jgi:hypothetical protein
VVEWWAPQNTGGEKCRDGVGRRRRRQNRPYRRPPIDIDSVSCSPLGIGSFVQIINVDIVLNETYFGSWTRRIGKVDIGIVVIVVAIGMSSGSSLLGG